MADSSTWAYHWRTCYRYTLATRCPVAADTLIIITPPCNVDTPAITSIDSAFTTDIHAASKQADRGLLQGLVTLRTLTPP